MVAPDGDGLLPKRPVGCVWKGEAVGGAPKPPKAGVALEAKSLELLVLLEGAALPKRLEPLGLPDEAILEPKRPVPGVAAKREVEPNPPPLEGRSNKLPVDVVAAGAGVVVDPNADALLVGAGLEPNKPAADPNPPAPAVPVSVFGILLDKVGVVADPKAELGAGLEPNIPAPAVTGLVFGALLAEAAVAVDPKADTLLVGTSLDPNKPVVDPNVPAPVVFGLVFGKLLAEAGVVVDPAADALLVDACPGAVEAPSDPSMFEVLPVDADLVLRKSPKPPTVVAVPAVEALAEAGRVASRKGLRDVVAVAAVEL